MILVKSKTYFYKDDLSKSNAKIMRMVSHSNVKYIYGKTTSTSLVKSRGHPNHKIKYIYKDDLSKSDKYFMRIILVKSKT